MPNNFRLDRAARGLEISWQTSYGLETPAGSSLGSGLDFGWVENPVDVLDSITGLYNARLAREGRQVR
jgi:hypothetical protein